MEEQQQQQQLVSNNDNNYSGDEATTQHVAVGKKLNLKAIDKKIMDTIIESIGKEPRDSPFKGVKRVPGSKNAEPPKLSFIDLPIEERAIQAKTFDEAIKNYNLLVSVVSVGDKCFITDRLTGIPCTHYYFTVPSSSMLLKLCEAVNGPAKGRAKKIHQLAGKFSEFHGAFATLENLFTCMHCVWGISTESVIFKDILKLYHCDDTSLANSKKLNEHYNMILKSKVFGGTSNPTIPSQASRLSKSLKCPGCFFYAADDESPFDHVSIKHSCIPRYLGCSIPAGLKFPVYDDWSAAVVKVKSKRDATVANHQKWKLFIEKYGKKAAVELLTELKKRKRSKRDGGEDEDDEGIVELENGEVIVKKPMLVDEDSNIDRKLIDYLFDDSPKSDNSGGGGGGVEEMVYSSSSSSSSSDTTTNTEMVSYEMLLQQQKELEEERLIVQSYIEYLSRELHDPFGPDRQHSDWDDEERWHEIIDTLGDDNGYNNNNNNNNRGGGGERKIQKKKTQKIFRLLKK